MTKGSFEEMDKEWDQALRSQREQKVPDPILKGFSASVERRIRSEVPAKRAAAGWDWRRWFSPAIVPTFAVLIIGFAIVTRLPLTADRPQPRESAMQLAQVPHPTDEISEEIAALRELGAWTDEDEQVAGVSTEQVLGEIELSQGPEVLLVG